MPGPVSKTRQFVHDMGVLGRTASPAAIGMTSSETGGPFLFFATLFRGTNTDKTKWPPPRIVFSLKVQSSNFCLLFPTNLLCPGGSSISSPLLTTSLQESSGRLKEKKEHFTLVVLQPNTFCFFLFRPLSPSPCPFFGFRFLSFPLWSLITSSSPFCWLSDLPSSPFLCLSHLLSLSHPLFF